MNKKVLTTLLALCSATLLMAQRPAMGKLSSALRQLVASEEHGARHTSALSQPSDQRRVCAFVRIADGDANLLQRYGASLEAQFGDICIATIPVGRLSALTLDEGVTRIEAQPSRHVLLDSMALFTRASEVYSSTLLPQAYTGQGVVVGVQDIGFDLTHPSFYSADGSTYRVKSFWDQLSADTLGTNRRIVGAVYATEDSILAYGHSRDGVRFFHGTHTLGIAAGSGAGGKYRGIAFDSDICAVSNAVSGDEEFLDSADFYKYTSATDALGFKYIFDYAESVGRPCVASFSEGSTEDLHGDDMLYHEVLGRMTGPGRILVASAGNTGHYRNYLHKPRGQEQTGTFLRIWGDALRVRATGDADYTLRFVVHGWPADTLDIPTRSIVAAPDSLWRDTVTLCGLSHNFEIEAYTSCYDPGRTVYDIRVTGRQHIGSSPRVSLELIGKEADATMHRLAGEMETHDGYPQLADGDNTHLVLSPGSAPDVICVGATSYRDRYTTVEGDTIVNDWGLADRLAGYSSVGPAASGAVKPDVVAPGSNVISAMGSCYIEANPEETSETFATFEHAGHTYGWGVSTGTSMSTPAVAGIIALWLEADPTLSPDDVKALLKRTCRPVEGFDSYPNNHCGYGRIDAYAGLLDLLGISDVEAISARQPGGISFGVNGHVLSLHLAEAARHGLRISLYSTAGVLLHTEKLEAGQADYAVSLPSQLGGVVAVQVNGYDEATTGSTLIRLKAQI